MWCPRERLRLAELRRLVGVVAGYVGLRPQGALPALRSTVAVPGAPAVNAPSVAAVTGLMARFPAVLVATEAEHQEESAGRCRACRRPFPCAHVRCAETARDMLGWPPAGHVQQGVRHG